jgi:hypothetical protein
MRTAVLLLAVFGLAGLLCAASPFAGTWKLNVAKSKFNPPSSTLKSNTVKIEDQDNGLKFTMDVVDATGAVIHSEEAPKFDGKDYPIKGSPTTDTVTLRRIDTNTFEHVSKKGGKEVERVRVVISKDGKTSTVTAKSKDAKGQEITSISIYEKQ